MVAYVEGSKFESQVSKGLKNGVFELGFIFIVTCFNTFSPHATQSKVDVFVLMPTISIFLLSNHLFRSLLIKDWKLSLLHLFTNPHWENECKNKFLYSKRL